MKRELKSGKTDMEVDNKVRRDVKRTEIMNFKQEQDKHGWKYILCSTIMRGYMKIRRRQRIQVHIFLTEYPFNNRIIYVHGMGI
jgi:hypothetical protein